MKLMNAIKHLKTVVLHKYYVMIECFRHGLYKQGILHDMSKFTYTELKESINYYTGIASPIEAAKLEHGYSVAWLHHKGHNKHHWQYWVDFNNGNMDIVKIPEKYLIEMACDVIGASKTYNKKCFVNTLPLKYFLAVRNEWLIINNDKDYIEQILLDFAEL